MQEFETNSGKSIGAAGQIRTADLILTNPGICIQKRISRYKDVRKSSGYLMIFAVYKTFKQNWPNQHKVNTYVYSCICAQSVRTRKFHGQLNIVLRSCTRVFVLKTITT